MMLVLARTANNLCQNDPLKQLKVDPKQEHPSLPRQPIKTGPTERKLQIQRHCISIIDADGERTDSRGLRERINVKFSCGSQSTRKHSRSASGSSGHAPNQTSAFIRGGRGTISRGAYLCALQSRPITTKHFEKNKQWKSHVLSRLISASSKRHRERKRTREGERGGYHNALVTVNEPLPAKWIIDWLSSALWSLPEGGGVYSGDPGWDWLSFSNSFFIKPKGFGGFKMAIPAVHFSG